MEKSILDILIKKNEFPVIFIGSGISKRYLIGYPSWEELLEELWVKIENDDFYGYLNKIRNKYNKEGVVDDGELNFLINTLVASEIETKVNEQFYEGKIEIEGLTQKDVYKNSISPFKKLLANKFSKYQVRESYQNELVEFKNMLLKSQIILTTNYDTFIEDEYNSLSKYGIKKYIGQNGFFNQTVGYAELYKIHGCVKEPKSLIINKEDYEKFDKDSILISSKIISMLLHSPIIFLGYSLTDRNVRKIIKDFTGSLNEEEKIELERRLIVIQWKDGMNEIEEEVVIDTDLDCRLTIITTDNFKEVYKKLSTINQGVAPSEIRRYQHVIKQLIVERGKAGELNTMLVSPSELDDIEKVIGNKNIVVAIGDSKIIFNMPNIVEYIYDYISENNEQNLDTMLRFITSQQPNSILPFLKYITEDNINESSLHEKEKVKLRNRLVKQADLNVQLNALPCKNNYNSLEDIVNAGFPKYKEYSLIAYNFDKIGDLKIKNYILKEVKQSMDNGEITVDTGLRRLALIYDLNKFNNSI